MTGKIGTFEKGVTRCFCKDFWGILAQSRRRRQKKKMSKRKRGNQSFKTVTNQEKREAAFLGQSRILEGWLERGDRRLKNPVRTLLPFSTFQSQPKKKERCC